MNLEPARVAAAFAVICLLLSSAGAFFGQASAQSSSEEVVNASLVAASGSNRFVVWQDDTPGNNDILFKRSTDNGATWKAVKNLSNSADESVMPYFAASGSSAFVIWEQGEPGGHDIQLRRSTDDGATWKSAINLSNNEGDSRKPSIGV